MSCNSKIHIIYLPTPIPDSVSLFNAILNLETVSGCEDIVKELTKKLEDLFIDVPEDKCAKKLDSLIYYDNGLITRKDVATGIVATPWKSVAVIKEPKKKPKKHGFYYLKNLTTRRSYHRYRDYKYGTAIYYQMRLYNKSSIPYHSIKMDLVTLIKRIEAFSLLSKEERKLVDIKFPWDDYFDISYRLKDFLAEGHYFTDKQCEEILLMHDTFPDNDTVNAGKWASSNLTDFCHDYLDKTTLANINLNYNSVYNRISNYSKSDDFDKYIDDIVEVYNSLYNVQDTNFRTLLIKLKLIEEGYMPNLLKKEQQNRPSGDL